MSKAAHISYEATYSFSPLVVDYLNENEKLKPFITDFPNLENLKKQIEKKKQDKIDRTALVDVLQQQYAQNGIDIQKTEVGESLLKLSQGNTFTITTAHQPNIFTGYLYTIYKIIHAIHLAQQYKQKLPEYDFVPVFFIGSEDNDIEEIGSFYFKEKQYKWEPPETGACGRFSTRSLIDIRDEVLGQFGTSEAEENLKQQILAAYDGKKTLAQATQHFLHNVFKHEGLVIIDADNVHLKQNFKHIIRDELQNQGSYNELIEHNKELAKNYKIQVEPREINLFYLKDAIRERIVANNGQWEVVNHDFTFDDLSIVDTNSELFSPNVVLRPLYQETILPNVAFVGGGSEIAYWLELKPLFDHYKLAYPLLYVRNSVSIVSDKIFDKMQQLGIEASFEPLENALKEKALDDSAYKQLLQDIENINKSYESAFQNAESISPNLAVSIDAQHAKIQRLHERIKTKYRAHIKRQFSDLEHNKKEITQHLFPNGKLQERHENYLELICRFKESIIDVLLEEQSQQNNKYLVLAL